MNRIAIAGAAFAIACLPGMALAQNSESRSSLLAPFKPGLTWKVEKLPQSQKQLSRGTANANPQVSGQTSNDEAVTIEENTILADGYRKQMLPGAKIVRYIRGTLVVSESTSGKDFFIESLDPELARDQISSTRLLEFAWIAPEWKIGTAVVEGVECDIFARPWPFDAAAENAATSDASLRQNEQAFAAVGRGDKLPRRLETPVSVTRYRFMMTNPPSELPAGAVLAIHRMNESAKEMAQRYAVPQ